MEYTQDDIKKLLGEQYDPEAQYVVETHRGAFVKATQGWKEVGRLPDSSDDEKGTMIVMVAPPKPKPPEPPAKPAAKPPAPKRGLGQRLGGGSHV